MISVAYDNETIYDAAIRLYGNINGVSELLGNTEHLDTPLSGTITYQPKVFQKFVSPNQPVEKTVKLSHTIRNDQSIYDLACQLTGKIDGISDILKYYNSLDDSLNGMVINIDKKTDPVLNEIISKSYVFSTKGKVKVSDAVTPIIEHDASIDSSVTHDLSNYVTQWNDVLGSRHLINNNSNPNELCTYDNANNLIYFNDGRLNYNDDTYTLFGINVDFTICIYLELIDLTIEPTDDEIFYTNRSINDRVGLGVRSGNIVFGYYNGSVFVTKSKTYEQGLQVITCKMESSSPTLRVNGVEYLTTGNTFFTTNTDTNFFSYGSIKPLTAGNAFGSNFKIKKIQVYNSALSDVQMSTVEDDITL